MSGVKITNRTRARAIPSTEDVDGVTDVDDNVDWDPTPGSAPGSSELDQWKQPVVAATTASITIATALNAGDTIDGVTLAAGNRVLVKDQSSPAQNGIYVVGSTPERAVDLDEDDEVLGAVVYVIAGTANTGTAWKVTNTAATIVDTDPITWAAFGGGGSVSYATPAIGLGTAAAAGAASTVIRSDSTIVAFDATVPVSQAIGDAAATGSVALAARRDHKHGMPSAAAPSGGYGSAAAGSAATLLRSDAVFPVYQAASCLNVPINGRGSVIGTGIANFAVRVKGNYTITGWAVYTDLSGAATIDIWKVAHASYPPTVANTIIGGGGTKPNSGSARKNSGSPTGWATTTLSDGDVLIVNVDANATNTWLTLALDLTRTS